MLWLNIADSRECPDKTHLCPPGGVCTVDIVSFSPLEYKYKCVCKAGYSGDGETCTGMVYVHYVSHENLHIVSVS